jgi:hypothetical protein
MNFTKSFGYTKETGSGWTVSVTPEQIDIMKFYLSEYTAKTGEQKQSVTLFFNKKTGKLSIMTNKALDPAHVESKREAQSGQFENNAVTRNPAAQQTINPNDVPF